MNTRPAYDRPFVLSEFLGHFSWCDRTTEQFRTKRLSHTCHDKHLGHFLDRNELFLPTKCDVVLPVVGQWPEKGIWTGMNLYSDRNFYGPFQIVFPLSVLKERRFVVFQRQDQRDRQRNFFLQYESDLPLFRSKRHPWRRIDPKTLLSESNEKTVWDLFLTQTLSLDKARIRPTEHPYCKSKICQGRTVDENRKRLDAVIRKRFCRMVAKLPAYHDFIRRFALAEGLTVELPDVDKQ